ncbi:hypothetical protein MBGDF03_00307 [Thermoplasmatales archaeon SCGC AB-540-F20]|nr:hypothetical protein MBGDF03_00307 [Thermoplasmatales archaeon SCGC AB-540-F20]
MEKMKLFAGILVFGSLWGFAECIIGPMIDDAGLPSGILMTSIFAVGLMMMSRMLYRQRGMQLGMGLVAGTLRLFNPFGGCVICSGIAIMAEGLLFELIWYGMSLDLKELKTHTMKISMGIISTYCCYVGGYIITQVLTPLISSAGFHLSNLIIFMPQILSSGLLAALIGGITVPLILILKNIDINRIKDRVYYPTTAAVSILCWSIVIANALFIAGA